MNHVNEKALARFDQRTARILSLDEDFTAGLRKDVLTLMKNVTRVKTYADAHKLREGIKTFRRHFEDIVFERFLRHDLKYTSELAESDIAYLEKKLGKTGWDVYSELGNMPLPYADRDIPEGTALARFQEQGPKWANRLKTKARVFWNDLDEAIQWYRRLKSKSGFDVTVPSVEKVVVEGFQCVVEGWDLHPDERTVDNMAKLKEGLKLFRKGAQQTLPLLLKAMLPLRINAHSCKLDEAGRYERDHINIQLSAFAAIGNPHIAAHLVAHEMGHHLWRVYLGAGDREFWDVAIRGNYGPLDVEKALRLWPEGAWLFEMDQKLKDVDPVLGLQLSTLGRENRGPQSKEDFIKVVESGQTINVPNNPITGYASKNTEEAFCEAVGRLTAFGARTVDPLIRRWLSLILPGLKYANDTVMVLKVAARYQEKKQVPKANGKGKTTVYVYSERQVAKRNKEKAKRLQQFKPKVEALRKKVKTDLKSKDDKVRLTALVVALIDETHERVGSPSSAKGELNDDGEPHFGVSTWLKKHVSLGDGKATISYVGKSGVKQKKEVTTDYVLSALRDAVKAAEGKESQLFEGVTGTMVNEYLKEFEVSAKDLRGLATNGAMQKALKRMRAKGGNLPDDKKEREKKLKAEFKAALEEVAKEIGGHEPSTLANQYLAPNMRTEYESTGKIIDRLDA